MEVSEPPLFEYVSGGPLVSISVSERPKVKYNAASIESDVNHDKQFIDDGFIEFDVSSRSKGRTSDKAICDKKRAGGNGKHECVHEEATALPRRM